MTRYRRLLAAWTIAMSLWALGMTAVVGIAVFRPTPAHADTNTVDNPWVFQMTDKTCNPNCPVGMEIDGHDGANTQAFVIKDHNGAPIFWVNLAGGASLAGDNLSLYRGGANLLTDPPDLTLRQDGSIQLGRGGPLLYGSTGTPAACPFAGMWYITTNGRMYFCPTAGGVPVRKVG